MAEVRSNGHTVSRLSVHVVWSTKYRYSVLKGDTQIRCRTLLIQICEAEDVSILKGVVSKDHVHMHMEYRPSLSVSDLVKKLKGRSSWAIGFGCWSTGNITDEMVNAYLEHHRKPGDGTNSKFIIEK